MNIKYEFLTGEIVEVEVSAGIGEVSISIDKEIFNINRRETRRHNSMEVMEEQGFQLADKSFDIADRYEATSTMEAINNALTDLLPQQRDLIQKMYFREMSIAQIARDEGVGESAIRDRLNRIYKKIKKFLD
ncbi:MAG: sigma-70 family RNA polymerase sigma factor [Desulfosporosinus sp.]|nr:sigma-70 family RNA polymerase sigma factor [Desulfosporosinus sp.]